MSSEALAVVRHEDAAQALMPVLKVGQAVERHQGIVSFVKTLMRPDVDFGKIPGTDKPTLLKPGAEKLTTFFGLSKRFHLAEKVEDWSGVDHGGEPFFYYVYRCALYNGDLLIAESDGSCNSFESKYRWRKGERVCPACGVAAIIKGREEYGGGWVCFGKKGGCGAKFPDGSPEIESQQVGRVPNPDVCDLVNTIQKMAQKRSFIAATLLAVNASEFFTQDVEDLAVEESNSEARPAAAERKSSANQPPHSSVQSNGKSAEEKALDERLLAHCRRDKGDRNAQAFFDAMYSKKTLDQKRAIVAALPSSASAAAAPPAPAPQPVTLPASEVIEGEIVEDAPQPVESSPVSIHLEIERLITTLQDAGCHADHINTKIARIAHGVYAIDEIDEADLPKVRQMLSNYATAPISAAEAMAKEFKKK
ncbi:MAG TPA: hypothetical protein VIC84_23100 [Blastocatellia bacterium]|jgi:hypothetical protein